MFKQNIFLKNRQRISWLLQGWQREDDQSLAGPRKW